MVEPIVTVEEGKLKGKTSEDVNGKIFYSFQGIPYGKPPVGDLRFKMALPVEPWTGIRDATSESNESLSKHMLFQHPVGSEDCLYLNVYTPQLPNGNNTSPKAVMVFIHGGGFTCGSNKSDMYGPEFLLTEDIVLVAINYRLGILGFLSLEDTSLGVPGNNGLKDMVLALKWVQKNISQFGGDPNNVTIFGESAGGAACHFLMLSPMAKGLFHRAILQSGCVLNPWTTGKRNAIEIANVLDCKCNNEKDAYEFLMKLPTEKFLDAQTLVIDYLCIDQNRPFGPVIEKPNPEAFITEDPIKIMLSGNYNKVPTIIGYTTKEGILIEFEQKKRSDKCEYRPQNFERHLPKNYNIPKNSETSRKIAKKIEDFYYGTSTGPEDDVDCFYQISSDQYFIRGIQVTVKSLLKTIGVPIFLYRFSVDSSLNIFKKFINVNTSGVSHGDDLGYLFKTVMTPKIEPNSIEEIALHRVLKFWTNFAKTGNPNPKENDPLIDVKWSPVTTDMECLDIGENLTSIKNPESDRMEFWDNIAATFNSNL